MQPAGSVGKTAPTTYVAGAALPAATPALNALVVAAAVPALAAATPAL